MPVLRPLARAVASLTSLVAPAAVLAAPPDVVPRRVPARRLREAPSTSCERLLRLAELQASRDALQNRCVTFHDVARVWFALCDDHLTDAERAPLTELFSELLEAFGKPRGGIVTSYFCRHIRVAAALTSSDKAANNPEGVILAPVEPEDEPEEGGRLRSLVRLMKGGELIRPPKATSSAIHIEPAFGDPEAWEAKEVLFRCQEIHYRAMEFLTPKPRKICMRMVFDVITSLLGALDARKAADPDAPFDAAEVAGLHRELRRARAYLERSMQRQAQLEYFIGMLWGWGAVIGAFGVFVGIAALADEVGLVDEPLILSALAGGVGAVVSVMQRMTNGRLTLAAEDGRRTIRILGGNRPVLGAILGVVLYVLLGGGLLPLENEPSGIVHVQYYVAALAFIAGFSERFAQDMITGAAGGVQAAPPEPAVRPSSDGLPGARR